jgi:hypothetical protein
MPDAGVLVSLSSQLLIAFAIIEADSPVTGLGKWKVAQTYDK